MGIAKPAMFTKHFALLAICTFLPGAAYAVDLSGVVSDEGDPVAMAEVILVNAETNIVTGSRLSDKQGRFQFAVSQGTYNLNISKNDYATIWVKGINVVSDDLTQNIGLTLTEFATEELPEVSEGCD